MYVHMLSSGDCRVPGLLALVCVMSTIVPTCQLSVGAYWNCIIWFASQNSLFLRLPLLRSMVPAKVPLNLPCLKPVDRANFCVENEPNMARARPYQPSVFSRLVMMLTEPPMALDP